MAQLDRRQFIAGSLAAGAALPLACNACGPEPAADDGVALGRPNILLIVADDVSAKEFGSYGSRQHQTPRLDRLASSGIKLETFWATPLCSPSRAELMTGKYGFRTGWLDNMRYKPRVGEPGANLAHDNLIFAQIMRDAGYQTAIAGKWQLRGNEAEHGFDEHCMWAGAVFKQERIGILDDYDGPIEGEDAVIPGRTARYWHPAVIVNDELIDTGPSDYGPDIFVDFLIDFAERHRNEPTLLYFPMCLPHRSWDYDKQEHTWLPVPEIGDHGPTGGRVPGSLKGNVEYMDYLINRLVDGVQAATGGRYVVMFTSDNGTSGWGKGMSFRERGQRVPMIINGYGVPALGSAPQLADLSDLLPTIAELGEAPIPKDYVIDGQSFAGLLRGQPYAQREWIYSYLRENHMLRTERWLLDGRGRLYDCGDVRDDTNYVDVTLSRAPEVVAARERFHALLEERLRL